MSLDQKSQADAPAEGGAPDAGVLEIDYARVPAHVAEAWSVLYSAYIRAGFVLENPFGVHTVPQAVGPQTLVVLARSHGKVVSTISAVGDNTAGLPLDSVFSNELNDWRSQGRKLLEVGLFGDCRDIQGDRVFHAIFEMMRYTFWFALHTGVTDFLCGIPPKRVRLYERIFGFRQIGPVKSYSTVNDNPVALMQIDTDHAVKNSTKYRAVDGFMKAPISAEALGGRYLFEPHTIPAAVQGFLTGKPTSAAA